MLKYPIRTMLRISVVLTVAGICLPVCFAQKTINVPADKLTIQSAILSASNGDTVLVSPGTYKERIDFSKKAITVKSLSGHDVTIIDGEQAGTVVTFRQGEGAMSVLQGFTIQNGVATGSLARGGGIAITDSSPSIFGNKIINNSACYEGGGIGIGSGAPLIQNNIIRDNTSCGGLGGGGIGVVIGDGTRIINNTITNNKSSSDGGGIVLWAGGAVIIRDNIITGNTASQSGGGIGTINSAPATIVGNLIADNRAGAGAGLSFSNPPLAVINNTIAGNVSTMAAGISGMQTNTNDQLRIVGNLIVASPGQVAFGCSVFGGSGVQGTFAYNEVFAKDGLAYSSNCVNQTGARGNISADPLFLGASAGNYRLQPGSPAINAGDATASELLPEDLDGNPRKRAGKVDIGAYEYPGPATATLSSSSLTFPQQAVGTSSSVQSISIKNDGAVALQFVSINATGDFSQTNTCPTGGGLASGASCIVAVTFTPTNRGARQGLLGISSNASGNPFAIVLNGPAVGAVLNLSATTLSFPNQLVNGAGAPLTLTLTNTGDYPLAVMSLTTSDEFSQTNTCNGPVSANAACTVSLDFHPLSSGTRTGTLTIASNSVGGAQIVNLAGNGQAALPTLTGLLPNSALNGGAPFNLTVQGANFIRNSVVRWSNQDRATTFVNTTQLIAAISAADLAAGGPIPVTVFNPGTGGGSSSALTFTVQNRVPGIVSISPSSALVGGSNFQLTVNGSGFVPNATVRWNGNDRATSFVNSTQLRADITSVDISFASTNQISVFNPAPGGGQSASVTFSALTPLPVPNLISINPSSATAGDPGFQLTVNGTGFGSTSIVRWNGQSRTTTFVDETQLQAAISASDLASGGSAPVTVFNPAPGGGNSATMPFTIAGNALPKIYNITPSSIYSGGMPVTLKIDGANFNNATVVQWNGTNRPTAFVNDTRLTATLTAKDTSVAGQGKVSVVNPPPGGGTAQITVNIVSNPAPGVQGLLPSTLVMGSSAQALRVLGNNFSATSVVRFNGQDRPTTFIDQGALTIPLAAADLVSPGIAEVRVFNPPLGGGVSAPLWFATTVGIPSNGMAYDATRQLLWISVPGSQAKIGNSVVSIDPATGKTGSSIYVGSEPGKIVISDDGHYLYAALNGTASVQRVDLTTLTADLQFPIGTNSGNGAMYAEDMAVMPGNSHAVAISRMYRSVSPRHAGVAIYDDGVPRKNITQTHTGSNRIEFSGSPTILYGYNNETTEFGFRIITVSDSGLTETRVYNSFNSSLISGFGIDFKFNAGKIYSTNGLILNPDTGTLIGKFTFPGTPPYSGAGLAVVPDADLHRTFFINSTGASAGGIAVFDDSTFTPIGTIVLPGLSVDSRSDDDLLMRWGNDGLALRTSGQIYLMNSPLVKPPTFSADSILTSGTSASGPLVPGSLATLYGTGLSAFTAGATAIPLPNSLAGVTLTMNGTAVPLYYASPTQINFQVPWELATASNAELSVGVAGFTENSVRVPLASVLPAVFTTGSPDGQAIAVIAGTATFAAPAGSLPGARPAQRGEYLTIYCSGLGAVTNAPFTGFGGPADGSGTTNTPPTVTIGDAQASILFAGLAPGLVGVYQVNVQIPGNARTGEAVPLIVSSGGIPSNRATVAIH